MALVRVYCGLAAAYPPRRLAVGSSSLTATIVDDAGRTLDVCDIGDDPYGYAYLSASLAERATGPYSVAIAADSDRPLVTRLLVAAGWALAIADDASTDDFAGRFGDPYGLGQDHGPSQRRALGLARALQAGVLSANLLPVADELGEVKPVLAAHSAVATGRHAATVALREVLRELYPAALRAYPDPADPVALSVLEAFPEPGMLGPGSARSVDTTTIVDSVTSQLSRSGGADAGTVNEAITALRAAIAETPRRGGIARTLTATVAETVQQAVAAVRACDAAGTTLVNALASRAESLTASDTRGDIDARAPRSPGASVAQAFLGARRSGGVPEQRGGGWSPEQTSEPAAPPLPARAPASGAPVAADAGYPGRGPGHAASAPPALTGYSPFGATASDPPAIEPQAHNRPVSPPPPPPPGITPIREPELTTRTGRRAAEAAAEGESEPQRVPNPRPALDRTPSRGSRSEWPTNPPNDDWATATPYGRAEESGGGYGGYRSDGYGDRWRSQEPEPAPSWAPDPNGLGDPLRGEQPPPEQPMLRLVEPTLPEELREDLGYPSARESEPGSPPLRLVEPGGVNGAPRSVPPVAADAEDADLLIFAQTRSAWFDQDPAASWTSAMDLGWQAAEQAAAQPTVGERTDAGLPRRVPQTNLVPGAPPLREERPLQVVRDPKTIAAHTSGYFSGWRKGQEIGGFPLGNRPARRAAGAWEFHRDEDRLSG
ncbi:transposase [Natronosporangium hydrolyticum]|uniref:Transposase n=1 Tax=Natronosporangium hydrolyticum TaxID=2811111 RepID=A0A895YIX2_9ACTN|nr:transposase [Natronosporangium hydrolyticum]QSB15479.1 transposase [Natronosporangium hydrolyticum]